MGYPFFDNQVDTHNIECHKTYHKHIAIHNENLHQCSPVIIALSSNAGIRREAPVHGYYHTGY